MGKKRKNSTNQRSELLRFLQKTYQITQEDLLILQKEKEKEKIEHQSHYIPVSIFAQSPLSSLEAITCFLRDIKNLKFADMEKILNRDQRVLSTTYRNAKKKHPSSIKTSKTRYYFPCHLISNKKLSVLENIVFYLKKEYKLSNSKIALELNKDPRTVWTVLNRIKQKENKK